MTQRRSLRDEINDRRKAAGASRNGQPEDQYPEHQQGDAWEGSTPEPPTPTPEWEPPVPLAEVPEAEPFPLAVLPADLAQFVQDAGEALSCPADYIAVPLLAIAGAAVGASRALEIKPGWKERPCLYVAVVGPPGGGKTPAQKLAATPVYAEQARLYKLWQCAKLAWEEADGPKGPRPTLATTFVSDITTEAAATVLIENWRGVAMIRDELTAWVASHDQYRARGRGADRHFYLAAWAGEPVSVHRKNQEDGPVFVPHPFLGVVGGLPPDLLTRLRGEEKLCDGFLDRILFAFPAPRPAVKEDWRCVSEEAAEAWRATLAALWALDGEPDEDGGKRPHYVHLTADGRRGWERFTGDLADAMNADTFPDFLRGPWSKFKGYGARLALILHCLRRAAGEVKREDVDGESMGRAAALVRYFQSQARKVYAALDRDPEVEDARRVLQWVRREKRCEFKRWEVFNDVKNLERFRLVEDLDRPLRRLVRHNYIRRRLADKRDGPGRPSDSIFEVNPMTNYQVNQVNQVNSRVRQGD
jgi:hypothetical protein